MHKLSLVLLVLLFSPSIQINQQCSQTTTCPVNSFCNDKGYCQCKQGYALDCQVQAKKIGDQFISVELSNKPVYFTIVPSSTQTIFVYRFQLCADAQNRMELQLFADQGSQMQLNRDNLIGQLALESSLSCQPLYSPYMQFDTQPNGNIQQMILKIQLSTMSFNLQKIAKNLKQNTEADPQNAKTMLILVPNQQKKMNLKLRVQQIYFLSRSALWIFIIGFLVLIGVSFIIGVAYCIYAIKKGPNRLIDNDIKYFDKLLPKKKVKNNDEYVSLPCSICLLQFEVGQKIRSTPCRHSFHHDCIDVWCKKNLTCPVCRNSLKKSYLEECIKKNKKDKKKDNLNGSIITSSSNTDNEIEQIEQLQYQLESDRKQRLKQPLQSKQ